VTAIGATGMGVWSRCRAFIGRRMRILVWTLRFVCAG
jgi:hypothetical protein